METYNTMKKASELGLEVIELEDQVLLVDKNQKINTGDFYIKNVLLRCTSTTDVMGVEDVCKKVICSTKPLEGLSLLVIEDDVELEYYKTHSKAGFGDYDYFPAFKEGYNKAKETYKFTEEDLKKAIDKAFEKGRNRIGFFESDYHTIIQSLSKKELWIEVETELDAYYRNGVGGGGRFPKITKGKIKAVWK